MLAACGDDDSDFATRPSEGSSSSVTPQSSDSETSVSSSSSAKLSSSVTLATPCKTEMEDNCEYGELVDSRDGQTYKTVTIGTQTWMVQNLNYAYTDVPYKRGGFTSDSTSWCYNDDASNCSKYGRLYTWAAAMDSVGTLSTNGKGCGYGTTCSPTYPVRGICPEGWHLPTKAEFETLFTAVGGQSTASKVLKSTSGWRWNNSSAMARMPSPSPRSLPATGAAAGITTARATAWTSGVLQRAIATTRTACTCTTSTTLRT